MHDENMNLPLEEQLFTEYCRSGDRAVFEKLYHMIQPWLRRMVYRICADKDVTNDILQETWQKLLLTADRVDPSRGRITNYLFTIAKNLALHHHRDGKRLSRLPEHFEASSSDPNPAATYEESERAGVFRRAIAALRPTYQSVILLHYYASLDVKEIAEMLHEPENTIKTWLRRARQQLAGLLPSETVR